MQAARRCRRWWRRFRRWMTPLIVVSETSCRFATNLDAGGATPLHALLLHLVGGRRLEEVRTRRCRSRAGGRPARRARRRRSWTCSSCSWPIALASPWTPLIAQLERLDQLLVLGAERAGRIELLRLRDVLALLLGDAGELAAQRRCLHARRGQRVRDGAAVVLRAVGDLRRRRSCSSRTCRASTSTRTTGSRARSTTNSATRTAIAASSRRSGVRLRGGPAGRRDPEPFPPRRGRRTRG